MSFQKTVKLKSGTELPIMNLKGKDYLQVAFRLVWFREEHPDWSIETDFLNQSDQSAVARAVIKDASGRTIATSHKEESSKDFAMGHREKAETGAIGRALALCGYGTQFEPEFDEGQRVVDSPMSTGGIHPENPGPNDGIQNEGPRIPSLQKDATDYLKSKNLGNPSGQLVDSLDVKMIHALISFLDTKYADKELPVKTAELHEILIGRAMQLEGMGHART